MKVAFSKPYVANYVLIALLILAGCDNGKSRNKAAENTDNTEIAALLQHVYKWHHDNIEKVDFDIIVEDSFQVGVDTVALKNRIDELKRTKFFTAGFVKNFERIGRETDSLLRHSIRKYYNEINFPFQDSDPWTSSQDYPDNYWDSLVIYNFKINDSDASLIWTFKGEQVSDGIFVKLKKEQGGWKINFIEGFDMIIQGQD